MMNQEVDYYRKRLLKLYKNYRIGAIVSLISVLILIAFVVLSTKSNGYHNLESIATIVCIISFSVGLITLREMKSIRQLQRNHIKFQNELKKEKEG